ncbi:nuclear valosin-containing protein-like isoform X2 [Callorhinchus milii]|uniref:nuclear valosin-containing protein-like isoform X2 n=1 Tax=Callorhinchus milii TaxID=7868 RepID=UPI001C3F4FDA|nr:nuclear valosin-containing protein-like isoform X2 [Callorhinchus milii]
MRNRGSYFTDARLKQRVKQYLGRSQYVDITTMAADMQRMYSTEYGRRRRTAFKIQVEKVYRSVCAQQGEELEDYEEEHLTKRARQGYGDDGEELVSSDTTDSESQAEDPPGNQMNSSLLSLYRKGNPESVPSTPRGASTPGQPVPVAASKPARTPGNTRVSEGGWFIDSTPGRERPHPILVDLCAEEKGPAQSEEEREVSRLEKRRVNKGKRRNKGAKQDVDKEIQSLLSQRAPHAGFEMQHSSVRFQDIGGNEKTLKEVCRLLIHMRHPEVYERLGMQPPRGVLLHGPPGCGKTLLAQAIVGELEMPQLKVAATEVVSGVSGESEQKLRELFEQAVTNAPCVIFIDEIDAISPKREVASKDMERRIVAQLLSCMDDLNNLSAATQVLVIGATNRPDSLDPALRRAGRFDREICLGIPDEGARERILRTLCRRLTLPDTFDYRQVARLTPGYVGADLMALCREAATSAVNRILVHVPEPEPALDTEQHPAQDSQDEFVRLLQLLKPGNPVPDEQLCMLRIEMADFTSSVTTVQPSAKREGFATVPDVTWADIGALEAVREELTMAILAPVRNPEQFQALGLCTPAGVLLAGPPGCGKTLLAKAVANESGLNFISVKGPELLNMYVGESERAVRQVFQRARSSVPCVIFFDEVDALCPRRSDHESGASVRVVNQLLTEMDGLEARKQVFIMAATNRPDILDPAVLRPGRLDKTLYVGLPTPSDRCAILQTLTKWGTRPPLGGDVDLKAIASDQRCDCFTGADLSALVREASINALRQQLSTSPPDSPGSSAGIQVSRQHFETAFQKVRSSVSVKDQITYEALRISLNQ